MRVINVMNTKPLARSAFHPMFAFYALSVAIIGFAGTYFLPLARGTFAAPWFVHAHGSLLFGWIVLLLTQTFLIRQRHVAVHRKLGLLAIPLAIGIIASTLAVTRYALHKGIAAGDPFATSSVVGSWSAMTIFAVLVSAALHYRKRPMAHRRLVLLATVAILWPAWFRFRHLFPWVPRPDIVFGMLLNDVPILVAIAYDRFRAGRVHPVYACVGSALIAEHIAEVLLFDSPPWRQLASTLASATG